MNNHKIIKEVDQMYKSLFRKVIKENLKRFPWVSIGWDDIYYEFLYSVDDIKRKYDPSKGLKEATYLSIKLKFFTLNKCRFYSTNKFKILNQANSFDDENYALSDNVVNEEVKFDLSVLNKMEMFIYENNILRGISLLKISRETGIDYEIFRHALKSLKNKMRNQMKKFKK